MINESETNDEQTEEISVYMIEKNRKSNKIVDLTHVICDMCTHKQYIYMKSETYMNLMGYIEPCSVMHMHINMDES